MHIPRPSTSSDQEKPGVGFVFVVFDAVDSAAKAAASLRARTFDGRKVRVFVFVFVFRGCGQGTCGAGVRVDDASWITASRLLVRTHVDFDDDGLWIWTLRSIAVTAYPNRASSFSETCYDLLTGHG